MDERLEQVYRCNIADAERLYQTAKESNDLELMQKATKDKQIWIDKMVKERAVTLNNTRAAALFYIDAMRRNIDNIKRCHP